jgi:hypothetical protein
MKALKEKRNSIRSLWRMGLVILSVFVFALALLACGNSSTADPYDPPISNGNGNGANGGDETEPPTTPSTPKITSVTLVSAVSSDAYSQEGQPPNLSGLVVNVIYDNAGPEVPIDLGTAEGKELFGTTPAILGYDQLNIVSGDADMVKVAAPVWINVYPKSNPGRPFSVQIPGVQALDITRGDAGDSNSTAGVVGATLAQVKSFQQTGSTSAVSFSGITIYQDEFKEAPAVGGSISVKYLVLYKSTVTNPNLATASINLDPTNPDADTAAARIATYPIKQNEALGATDWVSIPLDENYLFTDYHVDFGTDGYDADDRPYLPYGIDLANQNIALLISKGPTATHGGAQNTSMFITVPFPSTTFHYVRGIEIRGWTQRTGRDADDRDVTAFFAQSSLASLNTVAAWNTYLRGVRFNFDVYYDNPASPGNVSTNEVKRRDYTYFNKALDLGVGGVTNFNADLRPPTPVVSVSDDDNFGLVTIGYYTSLVDDDPGQRNPITKGDLGGFQVYKMPIAIYQEGTARMYLRPNALHADQDKLQLVVDNITAKATDNLGATSRITSAQLLAITNTYKLVADFAYESNTVVMEILTSAQIQPTWFSALATSENDDNFEVTLTVRGANLRASNPALATLYDGAEATFNIKLYTASNDNTVNYP